MIFTRKKITRKLVYIAVFYYEHVYFIGYNSHKPQRHVCKLRQEHFLCIVWEYCYGHPFPKVIYYIFFKILIRLKQSIDIL